jgi:dUTP pyrophosphatase
VSLPIKIKRLHDLAKIPTYSKYGDAGADIYSIDYGILEPGEQRLISTGIAIEIPYGWVGLIHPRSGLAAKLGVTVLNSPGTIDAGFRGEIRINLHNTNVTSYSFCIHDRIAQIIFQEVGIANFEEVDELSDSVRGLGGHGSTGGFDASRI